MTDQHPITPPPELVQPEPQGPTDERTLMPDFRALCAELHAAFNTYAVDEAHHDLLVRAKAALAQPEPPNLKEQALEHLEQIHANAYSIGMGFDPSIIRRALEQLPEPHGLTDDEIEERFQRWWFNEGSGMRPLNGEDQEEHAHRVSQIAWSNGACVARWRVAMTEPS